MLVGLGINVLFAVSGVGVAYKSSSVLCKYLKIISN